MFDKTKIIVCLSMLPQTTPSSLKMALKDLREFEAFKDELRSDIKYLQDFGGLASAHILGDGSTERPSTHDAVDPFRGGSGTEAEPEATVTERDLPAFVVQNLTGQEKEGLIAAINRATQQGRTPARNGTSNQRSRATGQPPPRDARDVKCANCGASGHTAQGCKKPRIPIEERKCHTCGKTAHIASKCPEKAQKANVVEQPPVQHTNGRILAVEDEDRFTQYKEAGQHASH